MMIAVRTGKTVNLVIDPSTCPVLATFMIGWDNALPTDAARNRLLKPLIPSLIGTRTDERIEQRRAFMALDWLMRVYVPTLLQLDPSYVSFARALRELPEIVDLASAFAAEPIVISAYRAVQSAEAELERLGILDDPTTKDAHDGASEAALLAALAAGWEVAKDTAWHTGGKAVEYSLNVTDYPPTEAPVQAAAVETAWAPIVTAPCNAVFDVALTAAKEAAAKGASRVDVEKAATIAATKALAPTVERLQASAIELVRRMIACSGLVT
jgi:hypothetical protein